MNKVNGIVGIRTSKQGVPCSSHGGRASSPAGLRDSAPDHARADAGKLPAFRRAACRCEAWHRCGHGISGTGITRAVADARTRASLRIGGAR